MSGKRWWSRFFTRVLVSTAMLPTVAFMSRRRYWSSYPSIHHAAVATAIPATVPLSILASFWAVAWRPAGPLGGVPAPSFVSRQRSCVRSDRRRAEASVALRAACPFGLARARERARLIVPVVVRACGGSSGMFGIFPGRVHPRPDAGDGAVAHVRRGRTTPCSGARESSGRVSSPQAERYSRL